MGEATGTPDVISQTLDLSRPLSQIASRGPGSSGQATLKEGEGGVPGEGANLRQLVLLIHSVQESGCHQWCLSWIVLAIELDCVFRMRCPPLSIDPICHLIFL